MSISTLYPNLSFTKIVADLQAINMELQAGDVGCLARDQMSPYQYAKDFRTVKADAGRSTGKTRCLMDLSRPGDIVFAYGRHQTNILDDVLPCVVLCGFHEHLAQFNYGGWGDIGTIWVDEATKLNPAALELIYTMFSHKAEQFVLLG